MYRIIKRNLLTKKIEVEDIDNDLSIINKNLEELRFLESCRVQSKETVITPIVNIGGMLSFSISRLGEHLVYQVEYVDEIFEMLSDIFKPINQN